MITIIPITLNEQSSNVNNLHNALKALGFIIDAKEVAERRAGESTLKAVRAFQQERRLRFDDKLLVDAPTAAALNKLLDERGLTAPEPATQSNHNFIVKGRIKSANGNSLRDLSIVAYDQDLRTRQELGTARANASGDYAITYNADKFAKAEKGSADLVLEVRSSRGETVHVTDILFHAPPIAEIDITLNGSHSESEFESIKLEIERLLDGGDLSISRLEENEQFKDVTFISGETKIDKEKIAHFIVAHKLTDRSRLDPEFWYGSLRGQVFLQPLTKTNTLEQIANDVVAATAHTRLESVEVALQTALGEKLINANFARSVPAWLKRFSAFALEQTLNTAQLQPILDLHNLERPRRDKLAQYYVAGGGNRNEVIKRLRDDASFNAAEVDKIEASLVLNDLTFGNILLVKTLLGRVENTAAIRQLAKTRREDWEKLLAPDPARPAIAVPEFIAGNTANEKLSNYAAVLTDRLQSEYPTAAFTGGLEHAIRKRDKVAFKHAGAIVEFLNANPEFELHTTSVEGFIKKRSSSEREAPRGKPVASDRFPDLQDREPVIDELKAAQRVFKLAPSFEATHTLLAGGIHSAHHVYRLGETKFAREYGDKPGFSETTAREVYQRAANTQAAVVTLVSELATAQNANAVAALAKKSNGSTLAKTAATNTVPNLQSLFGQGDTCECEHCRSVYSPAAYFADLLMFLDARDSVTPGVSVKQVLFERRKDIGDLELSCANANTPLPYVDVACEVLEDSVAPWVLFDLPLSLEPSMVQGPVDQAVKTAFSTATPSVTLSDEATISGIVQNSYWVIRDLKETYKVLKTAGALKVSILRQTRLTAEELRANPVYVNGAAYTKLSNAASPFALPLDLFAEEVRAYLGKVHVKRAGLMEVFSGTSAPNNPTSVDIAAEYFSIAKDEQPLILVAKAANQFVYWGEPDNATAIAELSKVDVFLRKTGLEYNDLLKLLTLEFINPGQTIHVVHLDSSCDTKQKRIEVLDDNALDRIQRFLRLWRKLDWQMWEVDLAISTGNGALDSGFIERLKPFAELKAKFPSLTVEQLCSFFANLNTTAKFTESFEPLEPSLYERLFLNPSVSKPIDPDFEISAVTASAPAATLKAHVLPICAALKVRETDLAVFLDLKRPAGGPGYVPDNQLSLANLSTLYRHTQLARLLKLKASEWQTLLNLAQVDPFTSTQATLDFVHTVEQVKATGFSFDELSYLLASDLSVKAAPAQKNVALLLGNLRRALQQVVKENDVSSLPADEAGLIDLLASQLRKLSWSDAAISDAVTILKGAYHAETTVTNLPKGFPNFPTAITKIIPITFNKTTKVMSFTGLMTDSERNTLLTDLSLSIVTGIDEYQAAINDLYEAPRLLLKFFQSDFTAPLSHLPPEIDFQKQLSKELAAKVTFDAERLQLRFSGIMSPAQKTELENLSTDSQYRNAVQRLHNSPRKSKFSNDQLWLTNNNLTFPLSSNVTVNLTTAVTRLSTYLKRTFSNALVTQQLAAAFGISPALTEKLLTSFRFFGAPATHPLLEDFTDSLFVTSTLAITPADFEEKFQAYYWLHRAALIVKKLKIIYGELDWLMKHKAQIDVLDLQELPLKATATQASLSRLIELSAYMKWQHSSATPAFFEVVDKLLADPTYDNEKFGDDVAALTAWSAADVTYLTNAGILDLVYPADFVKTKNWDRLAGAVAIIEKLSATAASITPLAAPSVGGTESASLKQLLRSKYAPGQWLDFNSEIQDELRHRKRDSLVAYRLSQPAPPDAPSPKWEHANDLYAYYLIDVEMCSCQLTSRIVSACSAIQLFVQRCFMGLEPMVRVSAEEDDRWNEWQWMKNYRVWEANRKVFLYPENWIAPELRRDKSQFFKELENELRQGEVNRDNVETALLNYIEKLDSVAQLEIAGTFYQEDNHTLHVFARTPGSEPHTYYYRQWIDDRRWTPWSKVDCDIKGDYLIPIVIEQRLYLVWPEFREEPVEVNTVSVPSAGATNFPVEKPRKTVQIFLAISENRNKKWSAKKLSKDSIFAGEYQGQALDKSSYVFLPLDLTDLPDGKFLIFFSDLSARQQDVFELLGCKGYPERLKDFRLLFPTITRFGRDEIKHLRNAEATNGNALIPLSSFIMRSPVLEKTPDLFKITYPHYLSYFDKLLFKIFGGGKGQYLTLGTFYNWFYADKARTFFVRPQLIRKRQESAIFYKDLVADFERKLKPMNAQLSSQLLEKLIRFYQADHDFKLLFQNFYHPHTCLFAGQLYKHGIDGLMSRKTQFGDNAFDFRSQYGPMPVVNHNYPREEVDFSPNGSYSQYNWELFFHAPLMIAMSLSKNQRFEEAMRWFHYIFDPTAAHDLDPVTGHPAPAPQKYWNTKPFFEMTSQDYLNERIDNIMKMLADDPANPTDPAVKQELIHQVADWRLNPFDPHLIAQFRKTAYAKTVVVKYLDNLIAWGDQLFRQDTMESINEAAQLYVYAAEILGPRPQKVPQSQKPVYETYNELEGRLDAFSNAIVNFENVVPVLPASSPGTNGHPLPNLLYFCIPQNDQLLRYWDTVADRLFKIRHCQNIEGVFRQLSLFAPPIDPGLLVKAVAAGVDIGAALNDLNAPLPHYRFNFMMQKTNEVVNDVKALGSALLSALEKKDAEALSLLRQGHELRVLESVRAIKEQQIGDAKLALEGLQKSKEVVTIRRNYYQHIERISASERLHQEKLHQALIAQQISQAINVAASIAHLIPNVDVGISGFGGSPVADITYGGMNFGTSLQAVAGGFSMWANAESYYANKASINAGHERRWDDWKLQERLANKELEQIHKQIAAAELKIAIAENELRNHDLQIENSKAVAEFMHGKFTNEELYDWMIGQISQVYFQSYQLAYDLAKRTERCFQHELGIENTSFIQFGYWDSLKKGLLSGESLQLDLRRLDAEYIERNRREFEITRHISLALTNPMALLELKENGSCFFDLPEELFDFDYQGHYFRLIKTVSVTIPCVVGPNTTVNSTLRLLKSSVRINSQLLGSQYEHNNEDGVFTDDPRFRESFVNTKAIAASMAQNDSGIFELNFRDERYLPFEGAGVISTWKLELTSERDLRTFDYETISDVIVHLRYTAREDAGQFKEGATQHLKNVIATVAPQLQLQRLFNLKHEFPTEWYTFLHPASGTANLLTLALKKEHFPFFARRRKIHVSAIRLIVKAPPNNSFTARLFLPFVTQSGGEVLTLAGNGAEHLYVGTRPVDKDFDESAPWTLAIEKGSVAINENDIEECFLIVEYNLTTSN